MTVQSSRVTVQSVVAGAARRLKDSGVTQSARLEAQLLLGKATGWSRTELLTHPERVVSPARLEVFGQLVERRLAAEPIAYLLGEREFYGRMFRVDRRALIPRPETELLVDLGVAAVARWRAGGGVEPTVVDVGTGSGAVGVSVAAETGAIVLATDVSEDALALAAENVAALAPGQVRLLKSNLLREVTGPLHVVLANLPYVPSARELPRDVAGYEPHVAIFGGQRGTEVIERLLREAREKLAPRAELAVELDEEEQAAPVAALARELYPEATVSVFRDAGGYERVVRVLLTDRPEGRE